MSGGHVPGYGNNIDVRLTRLERDNALLRAHIENLTEKKMAEERDISLTPSDVFHATIPHIATPPGYLYKDCHDDENNFDDVASPPPYYDGVVEDENEHDTAKQDKSDLHPEERSPRRTSPLPNGENIDNLIEADGGQIILKEPTLDRDVVADGLEKGASGKDESEHEVENEEEKEVEENMNNGATGGGKDRADKKTDEQSGSDSWIVLNKDGEKMKDESDGDFKEENITELVDRVETALEETSREEGGAFDRLVAVLSILLPLVLYMADELRMLRDKVKELLVHNRSLQKELRETHRESAKRVKKEMNSVGITALIADEDSSHCCTCQGKTKETNRGEAANAPDDQTLGDDGRAMHDVMKKEMRKLRYQCRELQQVNHSWEKYTQKLSAKHAEAMKKKDSQLALSEQNCKRAEKRLDEKFREYDQTLLHARDTEKQHKTAALQYRKERDILRQKYDDVKQRVRDVTKESEEKDREIKRLNLVMERQVEVKAHKEVKRPESPVHQQARVVNEYTAAPTRRIHADKQGASAALAALEEGLRIRVVKEKVPRAKQPRDKSASPPVSPRGPPVYENAEARMSLTRAELKDQVVLYKEQVDVYRADFNQERRDREKAMGHVESLKKDLEKTKQKLKEIHKQRKQEERNYFGRPLGHLNFLPESTQEMRMREIKQQTRGKKYQAHGRHYVDDVYLPEEHIYAEFD